MKLGQWRMYNAGRPVKIIKLPTKEESRVVVRTHGGTEITCPTDSIGDLVTAAELSWYELHCQEIDLPTDGLQDAWDWLNYKNI